MSLHRVGRRAQGTLADCAAERHVAASKIVVNALGIQSCRCRVCGCELRRLPSLRRWFRSGMMG
ncbi:MULTISPECIES: hypothetical protein [unclassified Novosphingobium]|uniref:hypothetical protein n=1 Tax=unclassified Novosphingobium TaxID=2644732 RepID=UPI00135B2D5D|nr:MULTISPECIES: hypothetical protein [unclassified Novosphingobium]